MYHGPTAANEGLEESGPWNSQLGLSLFPSQVATVALGVFGAFGLLLSIAGTFGLASYTVSKRLRGLSIRVALGAQSKQILSAALGKMLILLGSGSAIGIVLGVAASRLLSAIVYQASAQDPLVLAAVASTNVLTGSLSVAGPVRRVLRADPAPRTIVFKREWPFFWMCPSGVHHWSLSPESCICQLFPFWNSLLDTPHRRSILF